MVSNALIVINTHKSAVGAIRAPPSNHNSGFDGQGAASPITPSSEPVPRRMPPTMLRLSKACCAPTMALELSIKEEDPNIVVIGSLLLLCVIAKLSP
jgi:hypothetical protein